MRRLNPPDRRVTRPEARAASALDARAIQRPSDQPPRVERLLTINNIPIEDTFAEAFPDDGGPAASSPPRRRPGRRPRRKSTTGYASSVIGCDAEAGIERDAVRPTKRPTAGPASACCCSPSAATPCKRPSSIASASAS